MEEKVSLLLRAITVWKYPEHLHLGDLVANLTGI